MMFFDRRRGTTLADPTPDQTLVPLTVADAQWLVSVVSEALRSGGAEVTYDGTGMLQGMNGRRYGLTSLAAILATTPRRRWSATVNEHVSALLRADHNPVPHCLADIERLVLPRLTATGSLATDYAVAPPAYAPQFAPDVHVLAALDYPTHVSTLGADTALDCFGGWSAVAPLAFANLRALPAPSYHVVTGDHDRTDADVHIFETEDYHGASRALLLNELLATFAGVEAPPHGTLFVVPDRHLVAAHTLSGAGVVAATRLLVDIVLTEYVNAPGRMSPHLYYRTSDGVVEQLSRREGTGLVMGVTGRFESALTSLGLLDD